MADTKETSPGPFRRQGFAIIDASGRRLAKISVSNRIPTDAIEATGDLLAASWNLRELLRHVLICSGSPSNCETCKEATKAIGGGHA